MAMRDTEKVETCESTEWHQKYDIDPDLFKIEPFTDDVSLDKIRVRNDGVVVYPSQFEAGLRFPLDPFICFILERTNACIAQLHPNFIRTLVSFIVICRGNKYEPSLACMKDMFNFSLSGDRLSVRKNPGNKLLTPYPSKVNNWSFNPLLVISRVGWNHPIPLGPLTSQIEDPHSFLSGDNTLQDKLFRILRDGGPGSCFSWEQILKDKDLLRRVGVVRGGDGDGDGDRARPVVEIKSFDSFPGWQRHSGDVFLDKCEVCSKTWEKCSAMLAFDEYQAMNLQAKLDALAIKEAERKTEQERRLVLLQQGEVELTIPISNDTSSAVVGESGTSSSKRSKINSNKTKVTSSKSSDLVDSWDVPLTEHVSKLGNANTNSQSGHKRARPVQSRQQPLIDEIEADQPIKASWLQNDFVFPNDINGMVAVANEVADVPPLSGFQLNVLNPTRAVFGRGVVERVRDEQYTNDLEQRDSSESFDVTGVAMSMIGSATACMFNKLKRLQETNDKLIAERDHLNTLNTSLTSNLEDKNIEIEKLKSQLKAVKASNATLKAENKKLKSTNLKLTRDHKQEQEKVTELKREIEEAGNKAIIQYKESDLFHDDAETAMLHLYNDGIRHILRVAAGSGLEGINVEVLARWGAEGMHGEMARKGHSLVPFSDDEIADILKADEMSNRSTWVVPIVVSPCVQERMISIVAEAAKARLNGWYGGALEMKVERVGA